MQKAIIVKLQKHTIFPTLFQSDGNCLAWESNRVLRSWPEAVNTRRWRSGYTTNHLRNQHKPDKAASFSQLGCRNFRGCHHSRIKMDSEDEDLKAAIAASLNDAPSPPKPKNDTSVVDLTADTDDEVVPIFPKSKSVISSEASREASVTDNEAGNDNEELDEDLKKAIALSMQASGGEAQTKGGDESNERVESKAEPTSAPSEQASVKEQAGPGSGSLLGLDRKKMEEERLARIAKRKADSSTIDERELKQPRTESQQTASATQTPLTPSSMPSVQFPMGTVKKTFAFGHRRSNDDIKIDEVLQSSDLELGVLSSFMWDIEWLFSKLNLAKNRLLLVMQAKTDAEVSTLGHAWSWSAF